MATTRFADHLLEGDHASRPAATDVPAGTLYACTTHTKLYQSDGATWSDWFAPSTGSVAADTIWDAKGDLAVGSGADAADNLGVGSDGDVLTADSGQTLGVKWAAASGAGVSELAYVEFSSSVSITGTNAAGATTIVSSGAVTYAAVKTCIEIYCPAFSTSNSAGSEVRAMLWDGSTDLGEMGRLTLSGTAVQRSCLLARRYLTPSAGSHTYIFKAYRQVSDGSATVGAGGTGTLMPGYIRVTSGG